MNKDFNFDYFNNYYCNHETGIFAPYAYSWEKMSYLPHLLADLKTQNIVIHTTLILGAATGETLQYLEMQNIRPIGIENSSWAQENCLEAYKNKIHWNTITEILPNLINNGKHFDLIYSGCLQYLREDKVIKLLSSIKNGSKYFCHYGGYKSYGEDELDLRLVTLKSYTWWKKLFTHFGLKKTENPYLWKTFM